MPKVNFQYSDSKYEPCPHKGVHGVHRTKDGRSMGICMMGDAHIKATLRFLQDYLLAGELIYNESNFGPFEIMPDDFEWVEIEDKIRQLKAEQVRRKSLRLVRSR